MVSEERARQRSLVSPHKNQQEQQQGNLCGDLLAAEGAAGNDNCRFRPKLFPAIQGALSLEVQVDLTR